MPHTDSSHHDVLNQVHVLEQNTRRPALAPVFLPPSTPTISCPERTLSWWHWSLKGKPGRNPSLMIQAKLRSLPAWIQRPRSLTVSDKDAPSSFIAFSCLNRASQPDTPQYFLPILETCSRLHISMQPLRSVPVLAAFIQGMNTRSA